MSIYQTIDYIDGSTRESQLSCDLMRLTLSECGPDAKLFEPTEANAAPPVGFV
jgi:hypothetical protein